MSAIFKRRSVRSFLSKPVEPEILDRIIRAGFEAPSAGNRRPWEFMVFTEEADRQALAALSPNAKLAVDAAAVIVPLGSLYPGEDIEKNTRSQDIWWVLDLSAATENILLQISEEGLGGVWIGWYPDRERVKGFSEKFGLPPHVIPFAVIALGYPAKPLPAGDRYDPSRVHYGAYGKGRE
ncbi:MAG: nitroreductase family protein [Treponema sp.]|jgi:nitroreductase|nr:nitroreductase family protein [Treponema sp.]